MTRQSGTFRGGKYNAKKHATGVLKAHHERGIQAGAINPALASDATLLDYKRDRKSLPDWFFELKVAEASESMLEQALDESTSNRGKAWNRKLREVRAVLRKTLRTEIKPAEVKRKDPTILSAAEAEKVMKLAVGEGCALPFALLLFAGIRPEGELNRISWGNIREEHINISGDESKTEDDRHIPIMANLRAWLDACKDEDIIPENWKRKSQVGSPQ